MTFREDFVINRFDGAIGRNYKGFTGYSNKSFGGTKSFASRTVCISEKWKVKSVFVDEFIVSFGVVFTNAENQCVFVVKLDE